MRTDIIKIICDLPEDADEKYAGGLWDLAGLIQSICAGAEDDEEAQDRVYERNSQGGQYGKVFRTYQRA